MSRTDYQSLFNPHSICFGDFDSDNHLDLAVANAGSDEISIFINNGDGTFGTAMYPLRGANDIWVYGADLDGDWDNEIIVGNYLSDDMAIFLNFSDVPTGHLCGDANCDGSVNVGYDICVIDYIFCPVRDMPVRSELTYG